MADVTLSSIAGQPRRQSFTLTASNAALAIPSWAQGGKGVVFVTGVGGGSSGQVSTTSGGRGNGGSSGGVAINHAMSIASAVTTVAAVIGAGAVGITAAAATNGGLGGHTTLTVGSTVLTLGAGRETDSFGYIRPGLSYVGNTAFVPNFSQAVLLPDDARVSTLGRGVPGGAGSSAAGRFGSGAYSLFGGGGVGLAVGPTVNTDGANADGYGAGGAGALWITGAAVTSGAGAPGLLILEFVEGF